MVVPILYYSIISHFECWYPIEKWDINPVIFLKWPFKHIWFPFRERGFKVDHKWSSWVWTAKGYMFQLPCIVDGTSSSTLTWSSKTPFLSFFLCLLKFLAFKIQTGCQIISWMILKLEGGRPRLLRLEELNPSFMEGLVDDGVGNWKKKEGCLHAVVLWRRRKTKGAEFFEKAEDLLDGCVEVVNVLLYFLRD